MLITQGTALWMADHAERTIGVTGSKGKSTTSSLISHLLTAVDRSNVFGGNIGVPTLELPEAELYVLELSSYQCSDLTESPRVAVVTALFPEHLDAHGSEQQYYRDKLNLIAYGPRTVVVNGSDPRLDVELGDRAAVRAGTGDSVNVAVGPDGEPWFHLVDQPLFPRAVLPLVGRHNEGNLCVALAVLGAIGVDVVARKDTLAIAVAEFQGLAHRLTEIADPSGITFVDDTLATSPYAAMYAIDAYDGRPLTVILGGNDRGVDYGPLRDHLAEREITVIGIPDSGPRIVATLADLPGVNSEIAEGLTAAVRQARKLTHPAGWYFCHRPPPATVATATINTGLRRFARPSRKPLAAPRRERASIARRTSTPEVRPMSDTRAAAAGRPTPVAPAPRCRRRSRSAARGCGLRRSAGTARADRWSPAAPDPRVRDVLPARPRSAGCPRCSRGGSPARWTGQPARGRVGTRSGMCVSATRRTRARHQIVDDWPVEPQRTPQPGVHAVELDLDAG